MQSEWLRDNSKREEASDVEREERGVTRRGFLHGGLVVAGSALAMQHQEAHAQAATNPLGRELVALALRAPG